MYEKRAEEKLPLQTGCDEKNTVRSFSGSAKRQSQKTPIQQTWTGDYNQDC